ncbi:MAG: hypothetical protein M3141_00855 [Actinomycetota bacterium]|nr:hypothetical protein [Actinomycetota bacterium]
MHAIIVNVTVHDGPAATTYLREELVPRVSQAPGFVAGYWVRVGANAGRATIVCESEEAAQALSKQIAPAPNGATTIESVEVGEVVEHA